MFVFEDHRSSAEYHHAFSERPTDSVWEKRNVKFLRSKEFHRAGEKQNRKEERKLSGNTNSFEDMIAYVDENGRITSTPPETNHKKEEINHEEIVISTPRQESPEVRKGRVEYFNVSKGYGFIKDLSGTEKYFFHVSNALSELVENAIVIFDLERGKRGMNAINICISERTAD